MMSLLGCLAIAEGYIVACLLPPIYRRKVALSWIHSIVADEEKLSLGLNRLIERRMTDVEPQLARLEVLDDLIRASERKIKRLTSAFASEPDETIAHAYQVELKTVAREREALQNEQARLSTVLAEDALTETDVLGILELARKIRTKLDTPTFDRKRELLNILKVRIELVWQGEERWLQATCYMILTPSGTPEQTLLSLSNLGQKSSSTTTRSHPMTSSSWSCSASSG
jgi:hypothetical protein